MVVDVVGTLDECRFTYDGVHVSKEIARQFYKKTRVVQRLGGSKENRGSQRHQRLESTVRDGQWYVGIDGGAMLVEDLDLEIGAAPIVGAAGTGTGYDFDGVVGYDFGGFRLEAEVGYRENPRILLS